MNVPSLKRSVRQVERLEDRTVPATFQVTNTANAGSGSLRQAIIDANALVGADTITFAIGTGAQRIQPTTALPTITDAVTIDGRTQPGFAGTPLIEIDFNNLAGLVLGSSSTTSSQSAIRSLSLVNSGANTPAIAVQTNQNLIAGCFIGLRPNGTTVVANREGGIIVTGNNNTIGGANAVDVNVISGNQDTTPTATGGNGGIEIVGDGTAVSATGTGNTIINNTVGANPAGATAIGNQYIGIELRNGARTNTVAQNRVYASTIVSALGGIGIGIRGGANNNSIVANAVGSVFNSLGNPGSGIYLSLAATTNIVSNNIVAGNGDGLRFEDSGTSGNTATGNQIFGSVANGVLLRGAASNNAITGRNIISGNSGFGALITGAGTSGNVLRTNDFVANALGGVHITTSAANNQIGGTAAGQGNAFSNNGNVQVLRDTTAGTGNAVLGNSFSGVAPVINNTPANFVVVPNIATVTTLGGGTTIQGSITGGVAGTTYRFEIYDSSTQAGAGVSNGGGFLGSVQATTDATGFASFSFSTAFISHLSFYSATATDLTLNNTSEFSLVTAERIFAAGAGPGGLPLVSVFNTNGSLRMQFLAYDAAFNGGVHVATADFDGDGVEDVITGAGFGGGPNVKVYSGVDGSLLFDVMAYEVEFTGGVWVAGDDSGLIATGAGEGGGPLLRVFNQTGLLTESFVYDLAFRGGVTVAFTQDIDGDGFDDILTGAGAGGAPHVKAFSFDSAGATLTQVTEFFALDPNSRSGVVVSGGDFNGDGFGDVLTAYGFGSAQNYVGPVPDGFPRNVPYAPVPVVTDPRAQSYVFDLGAFIPDAEAFPFGTNAGVGVFVGSEDLNGDGIDDGIYGRALGSPDVVVLDGVNGTELVNLPNVFPGFRGGVFVG